MYQYSSTVSRKKIFISFDWHNDRDYRNMLSAWNENAGNPLNFIDFTPGAIDTDSVDRVKAVLTTKIREATHTLVLVGAQANFLHKDSAKIGTRNWIWWEIEKSKEEGNRLIGVKLGSNYISPDPLKNSNAAWATSFHLDPILKAISQA